MNRSENLARIIDKTLKKNQNECYGYEAVCRLSKQNATDMRQSADCQNKGWPDKKERPCK